MQGISKFDTELRIIIHFNHWIQLFTWCIYYLCARNIVSNQILNLGKIIYSDKHNILIYHIYYENYLKIYYG